MNVGCIPAKALLAAADAHESARVVIAAFATGWIPAVATRDTLRMAPERRLVTLTFTSWNQIIPFLQRLDQLRFAA